MHIGPGVHPTRLLSRHTHTHTHYFNPVPSTIMSSTVETQAVNSHLEFISESTTRSSTSPSDEIRDIQSQLDNLEGKQKMLDVDKVTLRQRLTTLQTREFIQTCFNAPRDGNLYVLDPQIWFPNEIKLNETPTMVREWFGPLRALSFSGPTNPTGSLVVIPESKSYQDFRARFPSVALYQIRYPVESTNLPPVHGEYRGQWVIVDDGNHFAVDSGSIRDVGLLGSPLNWSWFIPSFRKGDVVSKTHLQPKSILWRDRDQSATAIIQQYVLVVMNS